MKIVMSDKQLKASDKDIQLTIKTKQKNPLNDQKQPSVNV